MLVAPSSSAKAKDLLPVVAVGLGDPGVIHGIFFEMQWRNLRIFCLLMSLVSAIT